MRRVVERAPTPRLVTPCACHTEELLAAIPKSIRPRHAASCHRRPSADQTRPLKGCSFEPRCRYADEQCRDASRRCDPSGLGVSSPVASAMTALLSVENLVVEYAVGARHCRGVRVTCMSAGRDLGPGGQSGGQVDVGPRRPAAAQPTAGKVGSTAPSSPGSRPTRAPERRRLQLIFQDPIASLNPRRCIGDIVAEPLIIIGVSDKAERDRRVREVLTAVGLDADLVTGRLPHEFSGGQCQRICIARALILEPELVICDEPVSALDVSIRAQILNLLEDMKRRYGLTLLFIAHDLAVVKAVSDRIAVMYLGRLCEVGPTEQLFAQPAHPYTALLLEAIPVPDPSVKPAANVSVGEPPSPLAPPSGCRFRPRCPRADAVCAEVVPPLREITNGQFAACHHPLIERDCVPCRPCRPLRALNRPSRRSTSVAR